MPSGDYACGTTVEQIRSISALGKDVRTTCSKEFEGPPLALIVYSLPRGKISFAECIFVLSMWPSMLTPCT